MLCINTVCCKTHRYQTRHSSTPFCIDISNCSNMPTYSYIPPEYKTTSKKLSSSPSARPAPQQTTSYVGKEPRITFRDTGAAGKSIFGQAPSWKYKPLPPLPCERTDQSLSKPSLSKSKEHDCGTFSMAKYYGEHAKTGAQHGKIAKAAKSFSNKLTSTALYRSALSPQVYQ